MPNATTTAAATSAIIATPTTTEAMGRKVKLLGNLLGRIELNKKKHFLQVDSQKDVSAMV